MAKLITIEPSRTYATRENAIRAVDRMLPTQVDELRYFIHIHTDGRFFPVFVGMNAIHAGVHFHFNVIA